MKQFTKDDLKDGDKVYLEEGSTYPYGNVVKHHLPFYVCGSAAYQVEADNLPFIELQIMKDGLLTWRDQKVSKVVRDGTVLFEREPELEEVTLKLTQEQIDSLKEQGIG